MLDGVGDELFDAGVGDGRLVGHLVVAATGSGGSEEGHGVCHGGRCCGELSLGGGVCLLIGGRRREDGGRTSVYIVGKESSSGIDERCGLSKQMLRLWPCHVSNLGDLECHC